MKRAEIMSMIKQTLKLFLYSFDFNIIHKPCLPSFCITGKNNGFPILDIFGYLKNTVQRRK